jgi:RNA polymerase sigma-70 factor (ECF subfamily)
MAGVPNPPQSSSKPAPSPVEEHTGGIAVADFPAVFDRHASEVLRYAIRCVGRREIAEELTSEAFLKLFAHRDRVDPERAIAWLMACVKNLAIDYWRHTVVERRHTVGAPQPASSMPQPFTGRDFESYLGEASLKAEHRVCLTLHYVHGMERKEISLHTGLTDNQVKSALQYGLRLLRESVLPEGKRS